jgi:hypothetical protein
MHHKMTTTTKTIHAAKRDTATTAIAQDVIARHLQRVTGTEKMTKNPTDIAIAPLTSDAPSPLVAIVIAQNLQERKEIAIIAETVKILLLVRLDPRQITDALPTRHHPHLLRIHVVETTREAHLLVQDVKPRSNTRNNQRLLHSAFRLLSCRSKSCDTTHVGDW